MNPNNPANGNPNIFDIKDSNNVKHQVAPVNHTHDVLVGQTVSLIVNNVEIEIEPANVPNLLRALADPDSTPTSESTNLVTSGGVKASLDAKQNTLTFDTTPTASSTNPVTSGGVKAALDELIEIDAQETPTINTGLFQEGKKYQVVVYNPIEGNRLHEYFYSSSASEVLYMTSDPELISQHAFAMLVWRGEETGVLHVVYQGEFITVAINA